MNNNKIAIELENVYKTYDMGKIKVEVLKGVSFKVEHNEFLALMGPSGSGKSTCLNIIGCLDTPTKGVVKLQNIEVSKLDDNQLSSIRNKKIGFVFQMFNLLPRATAIENVELPLLYSGVKGMKLKAKSAIEMVGLGHRLNHRPNELSGGEQQRIAIARAIVTEPDIIIADEPTGNLDSRSGEEVLNIFKLLKQQGKTIVLVTHSTEIASYAQRVLKFKDGQIIGIT